MSTFSKTMRGLCPGKHQRTMGSKLQQKRCRSSTQQEWDHGQGHSRLITVKPLTNSIIFFFKFKKCHLLTFTLEKSRTILTAT